MAPRQQPLRGVNLGGWLVLEPWMTPSLFKDSAAVDEYTYCLNATPAQRQTLKKFRDTFITEQDFIWLANQGIEAVRLPVGFWLFGDEKPYDKTYQYVDMVFKWASVHGLRVLLDLHGVPGSQNGKMHSGQLGLIGWHSNAEAINKSVAIMERLTRRYGHQPALLGISLLNEPSPLVPSDLLEDFYTRCLEVMRPHCPPSTWFVFSDNFRPRRWRRRMPGLHIDHHQYQLYRSFDRWLPLWMQLLRARFVLPFKLQSYATRHQLIIGEWSLVLPGRRQSSRVTKRYGELQQAAFNGQAVAWFYWNYKTERGGLWNFRNCVERKMLTVDTR